MKNWLVTKKNLSNEENISEKNFQYGVFDDYPGI